MKTILIGLGNPILGDDGAGWRVVEMVKKQVDLQDLEIDLLAAGGIRLMEALVGFERAIIVDALCTGQYPVGSVRSFPLEALVTPFAGHLGSLHDADLVTAMQVGRSMGLKLPEEVLVVGIEIKNVFDFSERLSKAVDKSVPEAVELVLGIL